MHTFHQRTFISIICSADLVHSFLLCAEVLTLILELLDPIFKLHSEDLLLVRQFLSFMGIHGLAILILSDHLKALLFVLLEGEDFEFELSNLTLIPIQGLKGLMVALKNEKLLQLLMILLVQEFDLVGKFPYGLLICLMCVLDRECLEVSSALAQVVESLDFFIADVDLLLKLSELVLDLSFAFLDLL